MKRTYLSSNVANRWDSSYAICMLRGAKYIGRKLLYRLVLLAFGIFCFQALSINSAAAACSPTSTVNGQTINNFVCPGGSAPYTGNSYDISPSVGLGSNVGGAQPVTVVSPGQTVTFTLSYTPDHSRSNVNVWMSLNGSSTVLDSFTGHSETAGNYVTSPSPPNCPSFWAGSDSPYQNAGNAAADGRPLGYIYSDFNSGTPVARNADGFTGGCEDPTRNTRAWTNAGGNAGTNYQYSLSFKVRDDATSGSICVTSRISAGGLANMKARAGNPTAGGICVTVQTTQVKIKVRGGGLADPVPAIRFERGQCGSSSNARPRPAPTGSGTSTTYSYTFDIGRGGPYCISAPNGNGYTLNSSSPGGSPGLNNIGYQVAGMRCGSGGSSPYCNNALFAADYLTDNYTFNYLAPGQDPIIEISGRVSDRIDDTNMPDGSGEQIRITYWSNSCAASGPTTVGDDIASGTYSFTLNKGDHFCLVPSSGDFVHDTNGWHYKDLTPANYEDQVAGLDCRTHGETGDRGRECTGWGTSRADTTHIAAPVVIEDDVAGYCGSGTASSHGNIGYNTTGNARTSPIRENESCTEEEVIVDTLDGKCNGGQDEGYDAGGEYAEWRSCNQFINPTNEETLRGTYDSLCAGGDNEGYDTGGDYGVDERCNQFVVSNNYPGKCAGGADEGYDSGGDYDGHQSCNQQWTEAQRETLDGKCNGDADEGYGAGGQYSEDVRCNQFYNGTQWRRTIWDRTWNHDVNTRRHSVYDRNYRRTIRQWQYDINRRAYQNYPFDRADDSSYNFSYNSYVTTSGRVYNSTSDHGYGNASIETCNGAQTTNSNGDFSFELLRNTGFCVRDPQYLYSPVNNRALDGPYLNPAHPGNPPGNAQYSYEHQIADTNKGGYNLQYTNPILTLNNTVDNTNTVPTGECTAPANGTTSSCVRPGDFLNYTITGSNTGDATSRYVIESFIPQNIDPATVTITSFRINRSSGDVSQPGCTTTTIFAAGGTACAYVANGNVAASGGAQQVYDCNGAPCNNPNTPATIIAYTDTLGAGDTVELRWRGQVRPATQVGVFPADYRHCANASDWGTRGNPLSFNGSTTSVAGTCLDYASGLQAVSSFARSSYHWRPETGLNGNQATYRGFSGWGYQFNGAGDNRGGVATNGTMRISPIPGSMTCLGKTATATVDRANEYDSGSFRAPLNAANCNVVNPDGTNANYIYKTPGSSADNVLDSFNFNFTTERQANAGPVYYNLEDRANGADLDPAIENQNIATGGTRRIRIPSPSTVVNSFNSDQTPREEMSQTVHTRVSQPDGHIVVNDSRICWNRYWEVGYPQSCVTSNQIRLTQVSGQFPYFSTENGDVRAQGGIVSKDAQGRNVCVSPSGGNGLRNNVNAVGDYFVTTGADSASRFGTSNTIGNGIANYLECRSNIAASVEAISGTNVIAVPNNVFLVAGNNLQQGKVSRVNGNYRLKTLTVTTRSTLHVIGDLYITGNVQLSGPNASLGIVVTGNVYIDPSVTTVNAFIVAGTRGASGITTDGTVFTCAQANGPGTGYNLPINGQNGTLRPSQCVNGLNINGFLQGSKIWFLRTQTAGPAERIVLDPRFYTATPPGFSASRPSGSNNVLELLPRY